MENRFINVGLGNFLSTNRIMAIADPDSAPARRDMSIFRENGNLRDFTKGRRTRALIYMDDGTAIQSNTMPGTIANRDADKDGREFI